MKTNYSMTGIIVAVLLHAFLFFCVINFKTGTTAEAVNTVRLLFDEKTEVVVQPEEKPVEIPQEAVKEVPEKLVETVQTEAVEIEPEYDFIEPQQAVSTRLDFENIDKAGETAEEDLENVEAASGELPEENTNDALDGNEKIAAVDMANGGLSPSVCGNGVKEKGEECDDGNRNKYDGCSPGCRIEDEEENHNELYAEYGKLLRGYISKFTRYPERARRKKLEGVVIVTFEIYRDGKVENIQLEKSSGYSVLDYEALEAIRYPQRMPAPPENLLRFGETVMGRMTFNFNLENVTFED